MQPCEGVRVTPPIRVACDGTSTSFTGETRLIMPLDQAMYSLGTEQELVLLVSGVSGGVATMGGAVTLEFTRALAGTTRGGVSIQDAMSTFMRRCRLFARGGARWPVYVCAEQGLTFSAVLKGGGDGQVPKAVVDTLMGRRRHPSASGDDNTWEVNPQHRDALVRGIGLYLASKCSATIQLSGPCIVPYTIQASSDLTISTLHQSPVAVVALAPAFICMNRPVTVALRNLHVAHVSPLGLAGMFGKTSGYQHRVASQRLEVARKSAALVVGIFEGMVVAESCKFKTDMGWCTTEKGACIVMDSSRTSLRDCTMEVNIPGQVIRDQQLLLRITSGPKVCMCSCPGWGSVVATRVDRCDVPLTEGGCVVG